MIKHRGQKHHNPAGYIDNIGMSSCHVQSFTMGIGRRFFEIVQDPSKDTQALKADAITQELELFDSLIEGSAFASHKLLRKDDREKLSPWLQRTGWVAHLGDYPLDPLGQSATLRIIQHFDNTTDLDLGFMFMCVRKAFGNIWRDALDLVRQGSMHPVLTLLKTPKRESYAHSDVAPFRIPEQKETADKYQDQWAAYVMFCCRWWLEGQGNHISDEQKVIVAPHLVVIHKSYCSEEKNDIDSGDILNARDLDRYVIWAYTKAFANNILMVKGCYIRSWKGS